MSYVRILRFAPCEFASKRRKLPYEKLLCLKFRLYKPTLNLNISFFEFFGATFLERKVAKNSILILTDSN